MGRGRPIPNLGSLLILEVRRQEAIAAPMEMLKSEACVLGSKRNRYPKNTQEAHLWNQASGRTNKTRSAFRRRKLPETNQPAPHGVALVGSTYVRVPAEAFCMHFCINHTANAPQVALELLTIPGGLASSVTRPIIQGCLRDDENYTTGHPLPQDYSGIATVCSECS